MDQVTTVGTVIQVGDHFGTLEVISFERTPKGVYATCKCHCGFETCPKEKRIQVSHLARDRTLGCGRNHANWNGAARAHRYTFQSWRAMMNRCYNENYAFYDRYGGRGVTVCDRWKESFPAFLEDMGERPQGHSLDRIEDSKIYSPETCRWATPKEQANNRRNNVMLTSKGETLPLAEWAARAGLKENTIRMRLSTGWSVDDAVTKPARNRGQSVIHG